FAVYTEAFPVSLLRGFFKLSQEHRAEPLCSILQCDAWRIGHLNGGDRLFRKLTGNNMLRYLPCSCEICCSALPILRRPHCASNAQYACLQLNILFDNLQDRSYT